jgi:ubiquinone/menaquinone biosynthesis C-methylase UbiE
MAAAYDTYDYVSYWLGRGYEHKAEVLAIRELIRKIKKIHTILEIGAGFGRLVDSYSFRAKRVIISDPSSKLLKIARDRFQDKKRYRFVHSSLENLPQRVRGGTADLILLIRVIHHLEDLEKSLATISRLLKRRGYLILEYPNKRNFKTVIAEFFKGNTTFSLDIFPKDLRSKRSLKKNTLPFFNYHPDKIEKLLEDNDFELLEKRSVSNLRSGPLKKFLSTDTLLGLEKVLQMPLAYFSFGPSIFLLARKRD